MNRRILSALSVVVAVLAAAVVASSAVAADGRSVQADAVYRGTGTELQITAQGDAVEISKLPVKQKCRGGTPTNLGDFGDPGLGPFPIKSNGKFSNGGGGGDLSIKGRFKGSTVKGTVKAAAFEDKGFDCKAFRGKWSAELVGD